MTETEYGKDYRAHYLEIYKICVEYADRISSRREKANAFFLSANTLLVTFLIYTSPKNEYIWEIGIPRHFTEILIAVIGMLLCYCWGRLIRSYRDLNSAKYEVITEMEKKLPFSPYTEEWDYLKNKKNGATYTPLTRIEFSIPGIFALLYIAFALRFNLYGILKDIIDWF